MADILHTVEQGEYLSSIARDYGFSSWQTIYNYSKNADFRKKRPNPNVLLPGDQLYIPDKSQKQESASTDQSNKFQLKSAKACLRVVLKDADNKPIANEPYTLKVGNRAARGKTDGSGLVEQEIPIGEQDGELRLIKLGVRWKLHVGHLDPLDAGDDGVGGAQARLNNLGFPCGAVDGTLGPRTQSALAAFQEDILGQKNPTGQLDDNTRQSLLSEHGC